MRKLLAVVVLVLAGCGGVDSGAAGDCLELTIRNETNPYAAHMVSVWIPDGNREVYRWAPLVVPLGSVREVHVLHFEPGNNPPSGLVRTLDCTQQIAAGQCEASVSEASACGSQ